MNHLELLYNKSKIKDLGKSNENVKKGVIPGWLWLIMYYRQIVKFTHNYICDSLGLFTVQNHFFQTIRLKAKAPNAAIADNPLSSVTSLESPAAAKEATTETAIFFTNLSLNEEFLLFCSLFGTNKSLIYC